MIPAAWPAPPGHHDRRYGAISLGEVERVGI